MNCTMMHRSMNIKWNTLRILLSTSNCDRDITLLWTCGCYMCNKFKWRFIYIVAGQSNLDQLFRCLLSTFVMKDRKCICVTCRSVKLGVTSWRALHVFCHYKWVLFKLRVIMLQFTVRDSLAPQNAWLSSHGVTYTDVIMARFNCVLNYGY